MKFTFVPLLLTAVISTISSASAGPDPALPTWFPVKGIFSLNPDQITAETFGVSTFKVARPGDADYDEREVKGHHWSTSLYPPGRPETWDNWNGEAAWQTLKAQLERQGFNVVYLKQDPGNPVDATFAKQGGGGATYVEVVVGNDPYGNSLNIVQTAASTLAVALQPPAPTPEVFGPKDNFPYLTPLPGAHLVTTDTSDGPLDVTAPADSEPHLVGTGTTAKMYDGPPGISNLEFASAYADAFSKAGWVVTDQNGNDGGGYVYAHYAKNGRDIWAKLSRESPIRWDITVADVGAGLRRLANICKVSLYGVNFDFNKATLRPDSEPVLQQVLALFKQDANFRAEIGGHTDNVGGSAYNMKLSQERANSVKAWLVGHGVAAARITAQGYGDTVPLVPNESDANRATNRRVELKRPTCSASR